MQSSITESRFHQQPTLLLQTAAGAQAEISLWGGQLLSWHPPHEKTSRLYLSKKAIFDQQSPIRGGTPVCFPQFSLRGKLPKHGFARTQNWQLRLQRCAPEYALVTLGLESNATTRTLWPYDFDLELSVLLEGNRLDLELTALNSGHAPFAFTAALHTYLALQSHSQSQVLGLEGKSYRDHLQNDQHCIDTSTALLIDEPLDRIYQAVQNPLVLQDSARNLTLQHTGFPDLVIWNPGAQSPADMAADDFKHMLCIEGAQALQKELLDAGQEWCARQTLIAN